jgi:RNA polymerase sigma factor (sigma-70 family)
MSHTSMHPIPAARAKTQTMTTALADAAEVPADVDSGVHAGTPAVALATDEAALHANDGGRALFDRLGPLVFSYCRRKLIDQGRAEEVAQDVFVSAWKSRASFDPERASLATWIMGIARYKVMDAYRASRRTPVPLVDASDALKSGEHADASDRLADRLLIAHALSQLGPRAAEAIRLSFYEAMTQDEVAVAMGMPLGTVKSDIRRGLLRLRQILGNGDTE